MSPQLPRELVELIIENLATETQELVSFSLTNTSFVAQCQKHIFRAVRLWPYGIPIDGPPSPETVAYNRRALLLAREVIQNPSLGSYVQHLDYQVTSVPHAESGDLDDILHAIELMPNVVEFYLGSRIPGPLPTGDLCPVSVLSLKGLSGSNNPAATRWRKAMLSMVRRPKLRTLTLTRMRGLSIDNLSLGIQSLHLHSAGLDFFNSVSSLATLPRQRMSVKKLSCDSMTMYSYYVGAAKADTSDRLDLSRVENLKMEFFYLSQEYILVPLLNQAACLRELEFSVTRKINTGDMPSSNPISPLERIHPTSFNTLSHLNISINVMFRESTNYLRDPYAHMVDNALANLVALECLEFNFVLPSHLTMQHPWYLHWDPLPTILARPGAFPKLLRVAIHIGIKCRTFANASRNSNYLGSDIIVLPPTDNAKAREKRSAEKLAEDLTELVYANQFLPVLTLRPELDLSFTTEVLTSA